LEVRTASLEKRRKDGQGQLVGVLALRFGLPVLGAVATFGALTIGAFPLTVLYGLAEGPWRTVAVYAFVLVLVILGMVLPAMALAVLVHELGHLVAGLRAGLSFRSITVLGFSLSRQAGRWSFRYGRGPFLGGWVVMTPSGADDVVARYRLFILGGPVASTLYAALAIALYLLFRDAASSGLLQILWGQARFAVAIVALGMLPGTLLPFTHRGFPTDMQLLLQLRKPGPVQTRLLAILLFMGYIADGVPAADWPEDLVALVLEPEDGSTSEARAMLIAYNWSLDKGRHEEASERISRALEVARSLGKKAGFLRELAEYEQAYLFALRGRAEEAARLLEREPTDSFAEETYHRAAAALALARHDLDRASDELDRTDAARERLTRRLGMPSATAAKWAGEMRAALEAARHSAPFAEATRAED
jgi:hypothetical protein